MSDNTVSELRITGRLKGRRFEITVNGEHTVAISFTCLEALLALVECRLTRANGYTRPNELCSGGGLSNVYKTVSRLRQDIDDEVGAGAGESLIQHVGRSVYALNLPVECLAVDDDAMNLPLGSSTITRIARIASLCRTTRDGGLARCSDADLGDPQRQRS